MASRAATLWLGLILWMPLFWHAPGVRALPSITDPAFIQSCLDQHNAARSEVDPPATNMMGMTWDEALAKSARAWGKNCIFKHNPSLQQKGAVHPTFFPIGENIFISSGGFSAKQAIKRWIAEMSYYDYSTNKCKPQQMCGHYTQVVWANSYKVGCAVSDCPNGIKGSGLRGPSIIFVCDYAPAGNYIGAFPYKMGESCSACPICKDNLCRNAERDEVKKYPQWNPNFGSASISLCDQLLMLTSIIVIYILQ
uniref:GLIPR1-like protein 1 n=1 Tax=Pristiophorus japonicus TaxID=55135 RepID=UPI00398ECD6C